MTESEPTRLLFVEDEASIRLTLGNLLARNGFDLTTVATVPHALTEINSRHFDVLLCDLNIEKPGDGFVVISAMRYAQPHCISLVLTAYPSFENAMEAIQHFQVAMSFSTKPTDVDALVRRIKEKLEAPQIKRVPRHLSVWPWSYAKIARISWLTWRPRSRTIRSFRLPVPGRLKTICQRSWTR